MTLVSLLFGVLLLVMRVPAPAVVVIVCLLVVAGLRGLLSSRLNGERTLIFLLGLSCAVLPWFGGNALLSFSLLVVGTLCWRQPIRLWHGALMVLSVPVVWTALQLFFAADFSLLVTVSRGGDGPNLIESGVEGIRALRDLFQHAPPLWAHSLISSMRLFCLFVLMAVLGARPELLRWCCRGLVASVPIAIIWILSEKLGVYEIALPAFWERVRRAAGPFTDPNAFGVFTALTLPIVWYAGHSVPRLVLPSRLLAVLWVVIGLWSGSRSFILALVVYSCCALVRRCGARACVVGLFLALPLGALLLSVSTWQPQLFPPSIARVVSTFQGGDSEGFSSRLMFWQIAVNTWIDHPLSGVGFEQFRAGVTGYAARLGLPLGGWTDNANSLYLGVLAEGGILWFLAWVIFVFHLSRRKDAAPAALPGVVALAVLLIVGPHLDFDEVSIIGAVLLAGAVESVRGARSLHVFSRLWLVLLACALPTMFLKEALRDHGFFAWERNERGEWYRWTSAQFQGVLACRDGRAILNVMHAPPSGYLAQQRIIVDADTSTYQRDLQPGLVQEIYLPCRGGIDFIRYRAALESVWSPARYEFANVDFRPLGVKVFSSP